MNKSHQKPSPLTSSSLAGMLLRQLTHEQINRQINLIMLDDKVIMSKQGAHPRTLQEMQLRWPAGRLIKMQVGSLPTACGRSVGKVELENGYPIRVHQFETNNYRLNSGETQVITTQLGSIISETRTWVSVHRGETSETTLPTLPKHLQVIDHNGPSLSAHLPSDSTESCFTLYGENTREATAMEAYRQSCELLGDQPAARAELLRYLDLRELRGFALMPDGQCLVAHIASGISQSVKGKRNIANGLVISMDPAELAIFLTEDQRKRVEEARYQQMLQQAEQA